MCSVDIVGALWTAMFITARCAHMAFSTDAPVTIDGWVWTGSVCTGGKRTHIHREQQMWWVANCSIAAVYNHPSLERLSWLWECVVHPDIEVW